jgi:hypothetical protein
MEMRLANRKSSESALRNAAGFTEEEFKMFKASHSCEFAGLTSNE